jgi:hypothetical protein
MVSSTARAASRERIIPAERLQAIEQAIGTLQAAGVTITAEEVYREVRRRQMPCRRSTVQAAVRAWRQEHAAADVAPCPGAPAPPPPPPVPELSALLRQVAQLETDARTLERTQQLTQQQLAEGRAALRRALLEAPRLVRDCRHAQQQAGSPAYLMQPEMVARTAQLRQRLVDLVGEEETAKVLADYRYCPSWLQG